MSEQGTIDLAPHTEAPLPLSFDGWANLSARMMNLGKDERLDILDTQQIQVDDWKRCEERYSRALADDIRQGRMDRADLYASKCVAEVERRTSAGAAAPAAPEEVRATIAAPPEPPAVPLPAVPSFMQAVPGAALAPPPYGVRAELFETAMAFELPTALRLRAADALPFGGSSGPSLAAGPTEQKPIGPPSGAGETLDVGVNLMAVMRATLPFAEAPTGSGPVAVVGMSLQTYASLCAALAVFPDREAAIGEKYGVPSEAARVLVETDWRSRLEADPNLRAEWEQLFITYRDWLLRSPR
jgi:hypothetical protein